jgi:hypothetical protein
LATSCQEALLDLGSATRDHIEQPELVNSRDEEIRMRNVRTVEPGKSEPVADQSELLAVAGAGQAAEPDGECYARPVQGRFEEPRRWIVPPRGAVDDVVKVECAAEAFNLCTARVAADERDVQPTKGFS